MTDLGSGVIDLAVPEQSWVAVCSAMSVPIDRGRAVYLQGETIAIFRLAAIDDGLEDWFAVSHTDPFTQAPVIARGLVGSIERGGEVAPTVASPLHKQRFDLRTGRCIDSEDPAMDLVRYPVRIRDGQIELCVKVIVT